MSEDTGWFCFQSKFVSQFGSQHQHECWCKCKPLCWYSYIILVYILIFWHVFGTNLCIFKKFWLNWLKDVPHGCNISEIACDFVAVPVAFPVRDYDNLLFPIGLYRPCDLFGAKLALLWYVLVQGPVQGDRWSTLGFTLCKSQLWHQKKWAC